MNEETVLRQIPLGCPGERAALAAFLQRHELAMEQDLQTAFGLYDENNRLVGCGGAAGGLLQCFAVEEALRGQNALGRLVSALVQERFAAGFYDLAVITRAHNEPLFAACGFTAVAHTPALVMLENRKDGSAAFAAPLRCPGDEGKKIGAVVMNCNPLTRGHLALVEYAAAHCDVLYLFVVEEDRSIFPAADRLRLVQKGCAALPHVRVYPSGRYMISAMTFPTYFLKAGEDAARLQAELDAALFAQSLAPQLGITRRFAGEEPLDATTACYNAALRRILPQYGVEFCEVPRLGQGGAPISASRVRALLKEKGICDELLALVPPCTAEYLQAQYAQQGGTDHA